jgi:sec-independent protein translocase protein TatC
MSFLEHLEELRWHLIRSFIAIGVAMIGLYIFVEQVTQYVILAPMRESFPLNSFLCARVSQYCVANLTVKLQAIAPMEQFTRGILVAIIGGFVVAFPYIIWEFWRFLRPALRANESKLTRWSVLMVSLFFLAGVAFAYFIIAPFALSFFANYQLTAGVQNIWRIGKVIGLVVQLALAGGLLFELPTLSYFLSKGGLLTPAIMRTYRRHAIVVTMFLSAMITPPDIISQLLLVVPILLLYEFSIWISGRVQRQREREWAQFQADSPEAPPEHQEE